MGVVQEERSGFNGPVKTKTDYGVENVNVTSKGGESVIDEPVVEEPADDTQEEDTEANAKLFSEVLGKAIELNKIKSDDERLKAFGAKMEEKSKEVGGCPSAADALAALREEGLTEIADSYENVLAGVDIDVVVNELADIVEDAPAEEEVVGDEEPTDTAKVEEEVAETPDAPEEAPVEEKEAEPANDAPAEEESATKRKPGRPSKK